MGNQDGQSNGRRDLEGLAQEINREHDAAEQAMGASLAHARCAGALLLEVKGRLAHGQFMPWVMRHCRFAYSTAALYMKVAREWDRRLGLLGDFQRVRTLREAADLLYSASSEEEPAQATRRRRRKNLIDDAITRLEVFLQPQRLESRALVEAQDRAEMEYLRAALAELRRRVDGAIARLERQISGQVDEAEQRRVTKLLHDLGLDAEAADAPAPTVANEPELAPAGYRRLPLLLMRGGQHG